MAYLDTATVTNLNSRCIAQTGTFYSSGVVTATGNTGVIATPLVTDGGLAILPLYFFAVGTLMTTDETNDITIDWYPNATGTAGIGTTTFNQLTAGSPSDFEVWPGDVTIWDTVKPLLLPLPPYCKITHTLGGTAKSMIYVISCYYVTFGGA